MHSPQSHFMTYARRNCIYYKDNYYNENRDGNNKEGVAELPTKNQAKASTFTS